jgi:peptidoglycan/xylan/chitin deacetylase (PgdA/CDA1 family)
MSVRMLSRAAGRLWDRLTEATQVRTSFIPVLCYHSISDEPYAISPARFAAQMRWLRGHGYRSVGLERVIASQPTERAVAITFDDGLADLEHNALPALAACSFQATVFFCPELAGATVFYSPATGLRAEECGAEKRLDFMSWDQVERMAAAGMSFQSHGMSHARLTALDDAALAELVDEIKRRG